MGIVDRCRNRSGGGGWGEGEMFIQMVPKQHIPPGRVFALRFAMVRTMVHHLRRRPGLPEFPCLLRAPSEQLGVFLFRRVVERTTSEFVPPPHTKPQTDRSKKRSPEDLHKPCFFPKTWAPDLLSWGVPTKVRSGNGSSFPPTGPVRRFVASSSFPEKAWRNLVASERSVRSDALCS